MALSPEMRARLQAACAIAGAAVVWWRLGGWWPIALLATTTILALLAWIAPIRYAPIQRILDRSLLAALAALSWILLGVVYFVLFTPLRVGMTFFRRDPLQLRHRPEPTTYLRPFLPGSTGRFDRQF